MSEKQLVGWRKIYFAVAHCSQDGFWGHEISLMGSGPSVSSEVVAQRNGVVIGTGMGIEMGMNLMSAMEEWQESLECGLA